VPSRPARLNAMTLPNTSAESPSESTTKKNTTSTEHSSSPYYNLFTPQFYDIINHIGVFVETEEDGPKTGRMFEVTGNIVIRGGMQYEDTKSGNPEEDVAFALGTKEKVGIVKKSDLARLRGICQSIPVPGEQLNLNSSRIDASKPVRRCIQWSSEAVEALREAKILLP
jgi:hypothetical protein